MHKVTGTAVFQYPLCQAAVDLALGYHLLTLAPGSSEGCTLSGTPAFKGVCAKSQPLVQIPPSVWPEDRQKETYGFGR